MSSSERFGGARDVMMRRISSICNIRTSSRRLKLGLAALLLLIGASGASGVSFVASDGVNIAQFDSGATGVVSSVTVTGLEPGETLVGIDYRPANQLLYAIGSSSRLYSIDVLKGIATAIGSTGVFTHNGTPLGLDFNPVPDQIRVITNTGQNFRINPDTGALAATDTSITPASKIITAIAYDRNFPRITGDTTPVTLYGIDSVNGALVTVGSVNGTPNSPNGGVATTVGSLGLGTNLDPRIGLDIAANGSAFASILTGGSDKLYSINLSTGAATLLGQIGKGTTVYSGISAPPSGPPPVALYGINSGNNNLIRFPANNPAAILSSTTISGLISGDVITGLDFRPATGQLYGLGNGSRLYTINPASSVATQVGSNGGFTLSGVAFGFDFNPVVDRIRVVSDTKQNIRLNPTTGALSAVDTSLAYAAGDANAGQDPSICGAAYTNSFFGAKSTTLYDIDTLQNVLVTQGSVNGSPNSPNGGQLFTVGLLGVNPADDVQKISTAFDIVTLNNVQVGLATLTINGASSLYTVNLASGAVTTAGVIGGSATPLLVCAVTVAPAGDFEFSAPAYSVDEAGATATITINRLRGSEGATTVMFFTTDGTATAPGDYLDAGKVVSFADGVLSAKVKVPIVDDALVEGDETINLSLSNATNGARLGAIATAVLTIIDNDVATPTPSPTATPSFTSTPTPTATATPADTPTPTATPTPTPSATATPTPPTVLGNISTRLSIQPGDNVLIGGFIVTGTQSKKVLIRAIGPSTNIPGALADPKLQLFSGQTLLEENDNWVDSANKQAIIDTTIPPPSNLESAIVTTLAANNSAYTAIVSGADGGTGIGLVEVYDLDGSVDSKLANISTRGLVQTGDNVMIGGFIVLGQSSHNVLVRAIGPSLGFAGVLGDPTLELRDEQGNLLQADDNWRTGGQEQEIIATTIPPSDDRESALIRTVPPGSYTVTVKGVGDASGVALVEVYALQ